MSLEVKIPPMGESISSGVLAKWHVDDGASVKKDQVIYELETDKITSEGVAEADGTIKFAAEEGAEVKIGQVVATINESGAEQAKPESKRGDDSTPREAPQSEGAAIQNQKSKIENVSPAVRRIAAETGIDPANLEGTGRDRSRSPQRKRRLRPPQSRRKRGDPRGGR